MLTLALKIVLLYKNTNYKLSVNIKAKFLFKIRKDSLSESTRKHNTLNTDDTSYNVILIEDIYPE